MRIHLLRFYCQCNDILCLSCNALLCVIIFNAIYKNIREFNWSKSGDKTLPFSQYYNQHNHSFNTLIFKGSMDIIIRSKSRSHARSRDYEHIYFILFVEVTCCYYQKWKNDKSIYRHLISKRTIRFRVNFKPTILNNRQNIYNRDLPSVRAVSDISITW